MTHGTKRKGRGKWLIIVFWLLIWQAAAWLIRNELVLVGPVSTLRALITMLGEGDFRLSVILSWLRVMAGFLGGALAGCLLAALAFRLPRLGDLIAPLISVIKTVPVVSFVILALIWFGGSGLSSLISFLVVLPLLYFNTLEGLRAADPAMLEMAAVFRMPFLWRLRVVYSPTLLPFIRGALRTAVGMAFKSGAAAEVIGQPALSIGNGLYRAKIFLETDRVLAWSVVIILLSMLTEKALGAFLDKTGSAGGESGVDV